MLNLKQIDQWIWNQKLENDDDEDKEEEKEKKICIKRKAGEAFWIWKSWWFLWR